MPFREAGAEGNEVTTSSGLQYVDLTIGTGATEEAGQTVTVHYTGWLENGNKSDSSVDRGQPSRFLWALDKSSMDVTRASKA